MVALQIRDVPDEVRDILADRAQKLGQSLQAFLLDLVKSEAQRANNLALLRQFEGRTDGMDSPMGAAVREIAEARAQRDAQLQSKADGCRPSGPGCPE